MQAIITYHLPATNTKPNRVMAKCQRGFKIISRDSLPDNPGPAAARLLCERFIGEDMGKYGSSAESNPWNRPFTSGTLPDGSEAHVFQS